MCTPVVQEGFMTGCNDPDVDYKHIKNCVSSSCFRFFFIFFLINIVLELLHFLFGLDFQ